MGRVRSTSDILSIIGGLNGCLLVLCFTLLAGNHFKCILAQSHGFLFMCSFGLSRLGKRSIEACTIKLPPSTTNSSVPSGFGQAAYFWSQLKVIEWDARSKL
jgi:hypothetical protein